MRRPSISALVVLLAAVITLAIAGIQTATADAGFPKWPVINPTYQEPRIDRYVIPVVYQPRPVAPDGRFFFVTDNSGGDGPPTDVRRFVGLDQFNWIVSWVDKTGYHERYELGDITPRETLGIEEFTWGEFGFAQYVRDANGYEARDCQFGPRPVPGFIISGIINFRPNQDLGKPMCNWQKVQQGPTVTPTPVTQPTPTPATMVGFAVTKLQQDINGCAWDSTPNCLIQALDNAYNIGQSGSNESSTGGWSVPGWSIVWTNTSGLAVSGTWIPIRARGTWGVFYAPSGATVPTPGRSFQMERALTCADLPGIIPCN